MSIVVKMLRGFFQDLEADLSRPHPFAAERVGFVLARWARTGEDLLVFPVEYLPVPDAQYVDAPSIGVQINSVAIRAALQATLNSQSACLHVHMHHHGMPYFGRLDLREQDKLIPSFLATVPRAPHGALLLFGTGAAARIWPPDGIGSYPAEQVSIVGYPMVLSGGGS